MATRQISVMTRKQRAKKGARDKNTLFLVGCDGTGLLSHHLGG